MEVCYKHDSLCKTCLGNDAVMIASGTLNEEQHSQACLLIIQFAAVVLLRECMLESP